MTDKRDKAAAWAEYLRTHGTSTSATVNEIKCQAFMDGFDARAALEEAQPPAPARISPDWQAKSDLDTWRAHKQERELAILTLRDMLAGFDTSDYPLTASGRANLADIVDVIAGFHAKFVWELAHPPVSFDPPHSRACGIAKHEHGTACHRNCPTCAGLPA